jgi:ABC-type nitrate/sulfonate/bicarbonate transport system substrate-binding protein
MNMRVIPAAIALLSVICGSAATAVDRPLVKGATVTQDIAPWCLSTGFMKTPGFGPPTPSGVDVEWSLLRPAQAIIAVENDQIDMDDCVGVGTIAEAWKNGARNVIIVAVMGVSPGYVLLGAKGLKKLADLKGKTLATDGLQTNATEAVVAILQRGANLLPDRDYTFVTAASGAARVAALEAGKVDAVSSYIPVSYQMIDAGYPQLATERQYVPNYVQGTLVVGKRWAQANRATMVAMLKSMLLAGRWLKDPRQRDDVTAKLADLTVGGEKVGPQSARRMYDDIISVNGGVLDSGYADRALFTTTLNLLTERHLLAAGDTVPLGDIVDYSYLNEARRELGMPQVKPL